MPLKIASVLGILVALACLGAATSFYPGGFDWNRDFVSTLLRGPVGPARTLADVGVVLFCVSLTFVFSRLAKYPEFAKNSKVINIGGIGSMVYASLTITPMHDLMVTISLVFLVVALVALMRALYANRETCFFIAGCVCFVVLVLSAAVYYASLFVIVLPWAQRVSFGMLTAWLVALDFALPRTSDVASRGGRRGSSSETE